MIIYGIGVYGSVVGYYRTRLLRVLVGANVSGVIPWSREWLQRRRPANAATIMFRDFVAFFVYLVRGVVSPFSCDFRVFAFVGSCSGLRLYGSRFTPSRAMSTSSSSRPRPRSRTCRVWSCLSTPARDGFCADVRPWRSLWRAAFRFIWVHLPVASSLIL